MRATKKICSILIIMLVSCLLAGCDDVQLFEQKEDPYKLNGLKDSELVNDVFYIKDSTRFFAAYRPERGNVSMETTSLDESRVIITLGDDTLIPDHYKNEIVAYTSNELRFNHVTLERFYDQGYTIGCFGGKIGLDSTYLFSKQSGLVAESSFAEAIGETAADEIRVASIDGTPLLKSSVYTPAGVITGLEKDKEYLVGYYAGTKYYEKYIKADCHMYTSYEMFYYGSEYITDTHNGYVAFHTPPELKSGYYFINGYGLFRYLDFEKTEKHDGVNMNESYYADEKSRLEAISRQYKVSVPKKARDLKITVSYEYPDEDFAYDSIQGVMYFPNQERVELDHDVSEKTLSVTLAEAMAGDYTINIMPKSLIINEISTDSDQLKEEATCEETIFSLVEPKENIEFTARYKLKNGVSNENCTIYGTVTASDGTIYEMTTSSLMKDDGAEYNIFCTIPYLDAGECTVRIYHLPQESDVESAVMKDRTETDTDVIVIEG